MGGSYLKNTDSSNSILKIIGCFKSNALPNTTAIKKYFFADWRIGSKSKI
ncbi:hypothetical protein LEP1GSC158_2840 [Leptospira interrogans serovar Zanoni str. LT2156]|uniref:Uncharacterized protein n=1 Tax=Leptospira interrogans serovar Zanoni str. LT2156 TaxID=1001601 RepID=M6I3Z4_LEPIR|nr:hypothetical protein LEP1GSC158_2840 [Leptospira interrogans serovar Zanoni str. LT2156]